MFLTFCNYTLESKITVCIEIFWGEKYKSLKDRELKWLDDLLIMANKFTVQFKTLIAFKFSSGTNDQTIDFHQQGYNFISKHNTFDK